MYKYILFIILALGLFLTGDTFAASLIVTDYPKYVQPGEVVKFKVSWSGIPIDKGYKLIAQLENKDVEPKIFIVKEILDFKSSDTIYITLDIPKTINLASGCRFLAAFISKEQGWDDTLIASSTFKDVEIGSPYNIEIVKYPKVVYRSSKVFVILSWKNIPVNAGYKVIVQLENKTNIFVLKEIINFNSNDKKTITIEVPENIELGSGYRFVGAVVSKSEGWADVLANAFTQEDVVVKDLPGMP